jgi:hypothetical protein
VTTAVARDTVGAREATVVLLDATGTTLEPTDAGPCTTPPEHRELTARAVARNEPLFVAAHDEDPATAHAVLPLATTGAPVGALVLAFPPAQEFPAAQRDFLLALAGQCAQALERAQLYARQQSTAQILQRALLPDRLPRVPGLTVAARYQAAAAATSAVTGTTSSTSAVAASPWSSAMWSGAASARRRSWARCGRPSARTSLRTRRRRTSSAGSTACSRCSPPTSW